MRYKTFWLEPVDLERVSLRRYRIRAAGEVKCPLPHGYHDTLFPLRDHPRGTMSFLDAGEDPDLPSNDSPQWPTHCDCGYAFQEEDERQVFVECLYVAPDGKLWTLSTAPAGAMWDADWFAKEDGTRYDWATGPDGISLQVRLPNGNDWAVDAEASNCTRTQYEKVEGGKRWTGRTHYCWVRTGDPRTGNVHVTKEGNTCAAGAGSILSGNYHGFLHHGELIPA